MGLKLQAEVGLDGSGFESGLEKLHAGVERFTESIKGFVVGAVGVYTLEQAIEKTVETAKELVETSERLSIAPEQLQILRQAAKQSGTELEALANAFEKVDIARQKALQPGVEGNALRQRFGALGVGDNALRSLTSAQLFMGPLSQAARSRNAEDVGPILRDILGKGFGELMPVLKTDFDALEKKMRSFGAIMDTETAVKLAAFSKELTLVSQIITSQLGPAIIKLAEIVYVAALKIAGGISAMAAFVSGVTAKIGLKDILSLATSPFTTDLKGLFGKLDIGAGKNAAIDAIVPFQQKIEKFEKLLDSFKDLGKELDNPKPASFGQNPFERLSRRALETPSDSLSKIGNFLGGFGLADRWQQQIAQNTAQTARNTAHFATGTAGSGRFGVGGGGPAPGFNGLLGHNDLGFPGAGGG